MEHLGLVGPPRTLLCLLRLALAILVDEVLPFDAIDNRLAQVVVAHNVCNLSIRVTRLAMNLETLLLRHEAIWVTAVDVLEAHFLLLLLDWNFNMLPRQIFKFREAVGIVDAAAEMRCAG